LVVAVLRHRNELAGSAHLIADEVVEAIVGGHCTAGGAYVPALSDYNIKAAT
jgi:acetyl-CoA carboxylase carboxyltransferase component